MPSAMLAFLNHRRNIPRGNQSRWKTSNDLVLKPNSVIVIRMRDGRWGSESIWH